MFRDLSRAAVLVGVVSAVGQGIPREAEGQNRTGSDPSAVRAFELIGRSAARSATTGTRTRRGPRDSSRSSRSRRILG